MSWSVERLSSILQGKSNVSAQERPSMITALVLDILENQEQLYTATPGCLAAIVSNIGQVSEDFRGQLLKLIKGAKKDKKEMTPSHPAFPAADQVLQQLPPEMVGEVKEWVARVSFNTSFLSVVTALFMMTPPKFRPRVAEAMNAGMSLEQLVPMMSNGGEGLTSGIDPRIVRSLFQDHYLKLFWGTDDPCFKVAIAIEIVSKFPLPTDHPQAGIVKTFANNNTKHVARDPLTLFDQLANTLNFGNNPEEIGTLVFQILDLGEEGISNLASVSKRGSIEMIRQFAGKIPGWIRTELLRRLPGGERRNENEEVTVDEMLAAVSPAISDPVRKCVSMFEAAPRQFHSQIMRLFLFFPPELHDELHNKVVKGLEAAVAVGRLTDISRELRGRQEELRDLFVVHFFRLFKTTTEQRILKAFAQIVVRYGRVLGVDREAPIMCLAYSHIEGTTSSGGYDKIDELINFFVDEIRIPLMEDYEKYGPRVECSRGKLIAFLLLIPPQMRQAAIEAYKKSKNPSYGPKAFYLEHLNSKEKIETCSLYFMSLLDSTERKDLLKLLVGSAFEFIEFAFLEDSHPLSVAASLALALTE